MLRFIRFYLMWRAIKIRNSFRSRFHQNLRAMIGRILLHNPAISSTKPRREKVRCVFLFLLRWTVRGLRWILLVVLISTHPHFTCHKSTFPAKSRVVLVPPEKSRSLKEEVWTVARDAVSSKVLEWSLRCGVELKHWSGWRLCQRCGNCQSIQT